ncbi:MAG TPA: hypothetical protein VGM16_02575 [Gammaproteobacteria bacterium]
MQTPQDHHAGIAGVTLIAATLLSVLAMAHHPTLTAPDITQALQQLKDLANLSAWVHGILIALMLLIYWCLTEYSLRRGVGKPLVRAGLIFYGAGVVAMIGAAVVSGWLTARIGNLLPNPGDQDLHLLAILINFSGAMNRVLANLGAVAMSAGILAWSIGLLHDQGWTRAVGLIGVLAGAAPALLLITGGMHLDVHGMLLVVLVQGVWNIAVGILLIQRRI